MRGTLRANVYTKNRETEKCNLESAMQGGAAYPRTERNEEGCTPTSAPRDRRSKSIWRPTNFQL